jgi:hypothetical protein
LCWHEKNGFVFKLKLSGFINPKQISKKKETAMNNSSTTSVKSIGKSLAAFGLTVVLAMAAVSAQVASAQVVTGNISIDNTGSASSERIACNNGTSQQSRADCLLESKNANADKKSGMQDKANERYLANALARCERLKGEDRLACQARIMGYGTSQGSVAGGGTITEVETVILPKPGGVVVLPQ